MLWDGARLGLICREVVFNKMTGTIRITDWSWGLMSAKTTYSLFRMGKRERREGWGWAGRGGRYLWIAHPKCYEPQRLKRLSDTARTIDAEVVGTSPVQGNLHIPHLALSTSVQNSHLDESPDNQLSKPEAKDCPTHHEVPSPTPCSDCSWTQKYFLWRETCLERRRKRHTGESTCYRYDFRAKFLLEGLCLQRVLVCRCGNLQWYLMLHVTSFIETRLKTHKRLIETASALLTWLVQFCRILRNLHFAYIKWQTNWSYFTLILLLLNKISFVFLQLAHGLSDDPKKKSPVPSAILVCGKKKKKTLWKAVVYFTSLVQKQGFLLLES